MIYVFVHYANKYSEDDYSCEVMLLAENEVTVSVMYISVGQEYSPGGIWVKFPPHSVNRNSNFFAG